MENQKNNGTFFYTFKDENGNSHEVVGACRARELEADRDRLQAINAELVAALERILLASDHRMADGGSRMDYQDTNRVAGDIARAALAKAKEAQS